MAFEIKVIDLLITVYIYPLGCSIWANHASNGVGGGVCGYRNTDIGELTFKYSCLDAASGLITPALESEVGCPVTGTQEDVNAQWVATITHSNVNKYSYTHIHIFRVYYAPYDL